MAVPQAVAMSLSMEGQITRYGLAYMEKQYVLVKPHKMKQNGNTTPIFRSILMA